MTSKNYVAFAEMFKAMWPTSGNQAEADSVWHHAIAASADVFATDNPRFDRLKFMQACGMTREQGCIAEVNRLIQCRK